MKTDELVVGGAEQSWTSQGAVTVELLVNRSREKAIGAHTSSAVTCSTDSEEGPQDVNQRDSHVPRHPQTTTNAVFSTLNIVNLKQIL